MLQAEQPPRMRERYRVGAALLLPHLHCGRRPSGPHLGHSADAQGHRGPYPRLHGSRGRDQPDPVGSNPARLDRWVVLALLLIVIIMPVVNPTVRSR